jgi:hypothetical protein
MENWQGGILAVLEQSSIILRTPAVLEIRPGSFPSPEKIEQNEIAGDLLEDVWTSANP